MINTSKQVISQLVKHIDFTSLKGNESQSEILDFLTCGITKVEDERIACFCLDKQFASITKEFLLKNKIDNISLACVVNFPKGNSSLDYVSDEIKFALDHGVEEIDYVLDYNKILADNESDVLDSLYKIRELSKSAVLKVIIESGMLKYEKYITKASKISIKAGADFIKTSTGKAETGATIDAARIILDNIVAAGVVGESVISKSSQSDVGISAKKNIRAVGIKVSGGISDIETAWQYYSLTKAKLGIKDLNKQNFRIGTSKLFTNIVSDIKK